MAYGIDAKNDQTLFGTSEADNPNMLDVMWFTDCAQQQGTIPFYLDGAEYYVNAANGGAIGNNTAIIGNAFGYTACSGTISLQTGVTNNAIGYAGAWTTNTLIPGGITGAAVGAVAKYEYETTIRTGAAIHTDTVRGEYRLGFQDSISNTSATRGVFFHYLCNGTTTDTSWKVYIINPASGGTRVDTGVTLATNTTYRMYLSVQVDSDGTFTTNYKIKNITTGTNTEGTASPSSNAHYPSAFGANLGSSTINSKSTTATTTSIVLYVDYIATRIRRQIFRDILIAP